MATIKQKATDESPGKRRNPKESGIANTTQHKKNMKITIHSKSINNGKQHVLSCTDLLALAESKGDAEESLYAAELLLLRKIAETSSDLVKANEWDEFRGINGGMEGFETAHRAAVGAWEQWHADGEG